MRIPTILSGLLSFSVALASPLESRSTCNAADIKVVNSIVKYPAYFCSFWEDIYRTRSPFSELNVDQVNSACHCILETSVSAKAFSRDGTEMELAQDEIIERGTHCTGDYTSLISSRFLEPQPFCKFWQAWGPRTNSPFPDYDVSEINGVCDCVVQTSTSSTSKSSSAAKSSISSAKKVSSTKHIPSTSKPLTKHISSTSSSSTTSSPSASTRPHTVYSSSTSLTSITSRTVYITKTVIATQVVSTTTSGISTATVIMSNVQTVTVTSTATATDIGPYGGCQKKKNKRNNPATTSTSIIFHTLTTTSVFTDISITRVNTTVSPTVTETVLATTTTYDAVEYFAIQANGTGTSIDGMFLVDTTPYYQVPENFTDADGNNYTDYVDVNNPDYGVVFATKHISTASHFYLFECTTLGLGNESTDSTMWWNLNSTNSSQPYFSRHNPYESTDGIYCAFDDHDILPGQYRSLSCFYDEFRNNDPANLTVCNTNELWVAGNSTADCSPITLLVVPQHQYDDGLGGR